MTIDGVKYLNIISYESGKMKILEKLSLSNGLHYTYINMIESHMATKTKKFDPPLIKLWHERLGNPGSIMMRRIIESTHGHPLKENKIP